MAHTGNNGSDTVHHYCFFGYFVQGYITKTVYITLHTQALD